MVRSELERKCLKHRYSTHWKFWCLSYKPKLNPLSWLPMKQLGHSNSSVVEDSVAFAEVMDTHMGQLFLSLQSSRRKGGTLEGPRFGLRMDFLRTSWIRQVCEGMPLALLENNMKKVTNSTYNVDIEYSRLRDALNLRVSCKISYLICFSVFH